MRVIVKPTSRKIHDGESKPFNHFELHGFSWRTKVTMCTVQCCYNVYCTLCTVRFRSESVYLPSHLSYLISSHLISSHLISSHPISSHLI